MASSSAAQRLVGSGRSDIALAGIETALARPHVWAGAALALFAAQTCLVFTHEPWTDEWQALQIALQSPDMAALLDNLRYEGHPPLWYLLLRGIAALGVSPGRVLPVAEWPIAIGLQALILLRAPFGRLERLALATSFFVVVEYGLLSRSLGLGVPILTAAIAWRRHRASWAAVALLPLCDFQFGLLALCCIALQWREGRLWWPGLALFAACGLLAAWSVRPAPDVVPANLPAGFATGIGQFLHRLSVLLVPLQLEGGRPTWNMPLPMPLGPVAGPLFLFFADRQLRRWPFLRAVFLLFAAACALFCAFVYPLSIRHLSLIAWLLVLLKWIAREGGDAPDRWWKAWLATISACGALTGAYTLVHPFDAGAETAAWIRRHGLAGKHWISFPESRAQGVSARLGTDFHRLEVNCTQSFIRWNVDSRITRPAELRRALEQQVAVYGRMYILSDGDLAAVGPLVRPLARFAPGYDGQPYNLYIVAPNRAESALRPPPCAPTRLPLRVGTDAGG